jgi:glycosyltransferase involved in cell wall biosynthesis
VRTVHAVIPDGVDDPARPSGGNVYDRRLLDGLGGLGWRVHECRVPGAWPHPDAASRSAFGELVAGLPDAGVILIDGLIASAAPEALVPHSSRLGLVVLVHMPLGDRPDGPEVVARERAALESAAAVVTTSGWTRERLVELYGLERERLHIAHPGVDPAPATVGTSDGGALLCVGAVTAAKGHDVLVDALATVADLPWECVCVGSLERDPAFVHDLRSRVAEHALQGRVAFPGPLVGAALDRAYAAADLLVLASRAETYGMVVTEALARAVPVLVTYTGGIGEAVGYDSEEVRPGLLSFRPGDAAHFGAELRRWLTRPTLRTSLRERALERRASLTGWDVTAATVSGVLGAHAR